MELTVTIYHTADFHVLGWLGFNVTEADRPCMDDVGIGISVGGDLCRSSTGG